MDGIWDNEGTDDIKVFEVPEFYKKNLSLIQNKNIVNYDNYKTEILNIETKSSVIKKIANE